MLLLIKDIFKIVLILICHLIFVLIGCLRIYIVLQTTNRMIKYSRGINLIIILGRNRGFLGATSFSFTPILPWFSCLSLVSFLNVSRVWIYFFHNILLILSRWVELGILKRISKLHESFLGVLYLFNNSWSLQRCPCLWLHGGCYELLFRWGVCFLSKFIYCCLILVSRVLLGSTCSFSTWSSIDAFSSFPLRDAACG